MARDILKYHSAFLNSEYLASVKEYTPPEVKVITEDYRAGAMDGSRSVDMGIEPMEFELKMGALEVVALREVGKMGDARVTVRGAVERIDGSTVAIVHTLGVRLKGGSRGAWAAGSMPEPTLSGSVHYFKEEVDDEVTTEIDIDNLIRIVDGVDQMEEIRNALGL